MDFTLGIRQVVVFIAVPSLVYCLTTSVKNDYVLPTSPLWKNYVERFLIFLLANCFIHPSPLLISDVRDIFKLCAAVLVFIISILLFDRLVKYSNQRSRWLVFGHALLLILCQVAITVGASSFIGAFFHYSDLKMGDQSFYHQNWFYSAAVLTLFYSLSFPLRLKYELSHASLYHYFLDFMLINAVAGIISAEMFYSNKWHHLLVPVAPQIIGFMFIFLFAILYAAYYYIKRNNYNLTWLPTIAISFLHCVILGMLYSFYQVVYLGILYLFYPDT